MKEIVRENGEDIRTFIERACELHKSTLEEVSLVFGDELTLSTRGYNNIETMAEDIERDYYNYMSYIEDKNNEDDIVFEENIQEEDIVEEVEFEENIQEEDIEEEQDLISTTSLESLHLLTEVAMRDGNYPKIDLSVRKDIERELNNAKLAYQKTFEEKQRQMEVTKKRINDSVNERGKQIKEEMDLIVGQKKEYSKLIEEFKVELENLEKGLEELRGKLENGEFSQEVVDMINKSKVLEDKNVKSSEILEFIPIEELSHIYKLKWNVEAYQEYLDFFYTPHYPDRVKASIDILKEASIESKEEFKELMIEAFPGAKIKEDGTIVYDLENDDQELVAMREHIALLEEQLKEQDKHPVIIEDKILMMMYDRKTPEEITPLLDELMNNVKTPVITESFESDKERLETVNSEIEEVTEKINELKTLIDEDVPLNEDKIYIDNIRIERMKEASEDLASEIEKCDVVLAKKDNKARIKKLNDKISTYNVFMLKNIQQKNMYIANNGKKENDPEIAIFDQNIEFCKNTIAELKNLRKELREENKNNKSLMTVKQAEIKREKLLAKKEKVDKSIEELELDKQKKIDEDKYIDTRVVNQRKKELLKLEEELEVLENLKIAISSYSPDKLIDNVLKYNNPEYFEDRELEEEQFEENLSDTEKEETVVEENTSEEEMIFEENIHEDDLEEIIDEKPAKKGLLAFLKTDKFKKMAATALAVVVTGVIAISGMIGHHKNKETKEDIKEIGIELENLSEDTKVPEVMETVAEKENERREEEQVVAEEEKDMIDTSRIASDKYKAAEGDFIDEDKVHKQYFDEKMIEDIIDMQAEGKTVHAIVGHDGTIIGYTDQVNEVQETGKVK